MSLKNLDPDRSSRAVYDPTVDAAGRTVTVGRIVPGPVGTGTVTPPPRDPWVHDPDRPTHRSFARYADWRASRGPGRNLRNAVERVDEVNEATHAFVGAVAMLGDLVRQERLEDLLRGKPTLELIDRIGALFFTGFWLLDAFSLNPFRDAPERLTRQLQDESALGAARSIFERLYGARGDVPLSTEEHGEFSAELTALVFPMLVQAGLLAAAFRAMRWQHRPHDRLLLVAKVMDVLFATAPLLAMVGSSPQDALLRSVAAHDGGEEGDA